MTDLSNLTVGRTGAAEVVVGEEHTAPFVGSGRVRVLATPVMINLMEAAALDAVGSSCRPATRASASGSTCATTRRRRSACACARPRS
jgi:hypothetical protein